jgi:hypothetical protein
VPHLVLGHVVPQGWTAVAAVVYLASWKEDFAFYLWLEAQAKDSVLIEPLRRPTMPSSRTFLHRLGDYYEPAPPSRSSVMAFFSGGGYRLAHSSLEIQPAKLWRQFGWRPAEGFERKTFIAVGDGSFCNKTTFRQPLDRTILITRARKDLRLCFPHQGQGPRYYGTELFRPKKVYNDPAIPWKETKIFHGSKYRRIRFKEVKQVLWQRGGGRRLLRLFVLAPTPYRKTD